MGLKFLRVIGNQFRGFPSLKNTNQRQLARTDCWPDLARNPGRNEADFGQSSSQEKFDRILYS